VRAVMTDRVRLWGASAALFILTMGGLFTLYQVCFDVWMTAYPLADTSEWRARLCLRLVRIIVIAFFWSGIVAWLFRHRRSG
jgi:hypothetical protein